MDPNDFSSTVDSIRNSSVSRRGGVRTRGGRLPPIRVRDTAIVPASTKKVVAPKIPQRRSKVKEEIIDYNENYKTKDIRKDCEPNTQQKSSRGRGPRVYVQSEGTFLGEGPALKLKKEVSTVSYERGSRGSKSQPAGELKLDPSSLKYLFEDYDEDEVFDEYFLPPVRYPIIKQELKNDVKPEIKEEIKLEIKKEALDDDFNPDVKIVIKTEPPDSDTEIPTEETKIVEKTEKIDLSEKAKNYFLGEDTFVLLQFPSFLPFKKVVEKSDVSTDSATKTSKVGKQNDENTNTEVDLKSLTEGRIGKLQILRSGEMRLVTGLATMTVESTMAIPSVCEVVSVHVGNDRTGGDLIKLGRVDRKLVLRPFLNNEIMNCNL